MKNYRILLLVLLAGLSLVTIPGLVSAHGESREWLIVPYFSGNLQLETDHFAAQWNSGREALLNSTWNSEISIVGLNNGTHLYFHIRWLDRTYSSTEEDGLAIFFEGASVNGTDDYWLWSTNSQLMSAGGVHSAAVWKEDYWNVAIGRSLAAPSSSSVGLSVGESRDGFLKVAVWDGSEGQSLAQIDPETIPHLGLYILPYIDFYPKDGFIWLSILGVGLVVFSYKELKLSSWRNRK